MNTCGKKLNSEVHVMVYVANIPSGIIPSEVYPPIRQREIESSPHNIAIQKYAVWRLLEYAIYRSYGLNMPELTFTKSDSGKWLSDRISYSLSHTEDAVAVALSLDAVGVDMENVSRTISPTVAKRILTEAERAKYDTLAESLKNEYLLRRWVSREASVKAMGRASFRGDAIAKHVSTLDIHINGKNYLIGVAGDQRDIEVTVLSPEETKSIYRT